MQKQKASCTAETLTATARQNLFLPICNRNYLIWILVQICVILALKINIYWLYKYSPLILISTSKYVHLCDIFQSLVSIISHLYRNKQKKKHCGFLFPEKETTVLTVMLGQDGGGLCYLMWTDQRQTAWWTELLYYDCSVSSLFDFIFGLRLENTFSVYTGPNS